MRQQDNTSNATCNIKGRGRPTQAVLAEHTGYQHQAPPVLPAPATCKGTPKHALDAVVKVTERWVPIGRRLPHPKRDHTRLTMPIPCDATQTTNTCIDANCQANITACHRRSWSVQEKDKRSARRSLVLRRAFEHRLSTNTHAMQKSRDHATTHFSRRGQGARALQGSTTERSQSRSSTDPRRAPRRNS